MEYISQKQIVEGLIVELSSLMPLNRLVKMKEYFADKCDEVRMTIMREEWNNKKFVDESYYQYSKCQEIECYTNSCTIDGITFETQTGVFMVSLPPLITGIGWDNIKGIGTNDFKHSFHRMSLLSFINYTPQYAKPAPIFTLVGNDLYLTNLPTKGMKFLAGAFLFQVPSTSCGWKNTDYYPVPSVYKLKFLIKRDFLALQPQQPEQPKRTEDNENNENVQSQ